MDKSIDKSLMLKNIVNCKKRTVSLRIEPGPLRPLFEICPLYHHGMLKKVDISNELLEQEDWNINRYIER